MQIIKLFARCVLACFYVDDINTFWLIREQILRGSHFPKLWTFFAKIIRKHYACGIPISADINRFSTPHGFYGIFISKNACIGKGCIIFQHVTIGRDNLGGAPSVGEGCFIGAGAVLVGKIKIGKQVKIGAGAIVTQDIPDNSTVVMEKPRIIRH